MGGVRTVVITDRSNTVILRIGEGENISREAAIDQARALDPDRIVIVEPGQPVEEVGGLDREAYIKGLEEIALESLPSSNEAIVEMLANLRAECGGEAEL